MQAVVKCEKKDKKEIRQFLEEKLKEACFEGYGREVEISPTNSGFKTDFPNFGPYFVEIVSQEDGFTIDYPFGLMYGPYGSFEYCDSIAWAFEELKNHFKNIEVEGLVYFYDHIGYYTGGFYFFCKSTDRKLRKVYKWQQCKICGKVLKKNAFFNSSSYDEDGGDGSKVCLCSPECVISYALNPYQNTYQDGSRLDVNKQIYDIFLDSGFDDFEEFLLQYLPDDIRDSGFDEVGEFLLQYFTDDIMRHFRKYKKAFFNNKKTLLKKGANKYNKDLYDFLVKKCSEAQVEDNNEQK